jgi:hypothetical protein
LELLSLVLWLLVVVVTAILVSALHSRRNHIFLCGSLLATPVAIVSAGEIAVTAFEADPVVVAPS